MKDIRFCKIDEIVDIQLYESSKTGYIFVPEKTKKRFWKTITMPEHYKYYGSGRYTESDIYKITTKGIPTFLIKDHVVYEKPKVFISFSRHSNISQVTKLFMTFEQAESWIHKFLKDNGLDKALIKIK